ncbi:ribosomal subunit interface protein [Candidatus Nomurabacteria bacterium RIFCSPHIGHO2_02_FULL_41_18]|uniref:Ribosomal subunit interface protein n=1 Tax=Candidatus Nomurabacteria bacterium RIFCSPHIGHO2_02_FULL_41_18 TaxID=1801754 RepID=A0A1F6W735_9BACT|nr:MAG: ribosomal subunit interface protein [Candidatus Nomurabacteria bacterium RIFCSPHIGHO2_01_FULL_41_71]OGI77713.1 MAG: ribosomal subunit interface protein [Candidatus Nomurabacteria bacterium RIFCSPHIGHO2_02_FULL_41_18]OGI89959.1 MAG: ribosomal subunit interface protein [Candidatus Nomurabacteria bacterium RIFCSPLOWO2_01_FULL_41_52b]OGJ00447.1 MAG: ribosomal subunit interface protein [Candidatus Nomurabacteria bacterium RIFCSPLOWO2_02_FULL_41_9]
MRINLQSKNMELPDTAHDYVVKRITNLEKLLSRIEEEQRKVMVNFEISRSTNHHKSGDVFHADCLINIDGQKFYTSADKNDLYAAVDEVKDNLFQEINKNKDRAQTLFQRGARSIKKMMKGLSKRNPFTSKY